MESYRFLGIKPKTLKDVLREDAQFEKLKADIEGQYAKNDLNKSRGIIASEQAKYAPQMAQEKLTGEQLLNAVRHNNAQYAPYLSRARLSDILMSSNLKQRRIDEINQAMHYSPLLNEARLKNLEASTKQKGEPGFSGRNLKTAAGLEAQIQYAKDNQANPLYPSHKFSPTELENFLDPLQSTLDQEVLPKNDYVFLERMQLIHDLYDNIRNIEKIAQFAGRKGSIKQWIAKGKRGFLGIEQPEYEAYERFTKQAVPLIASVWKQANKQSIQPVVQKKYEKLLSKDTWDQSPESFIRYFKESKQFVDSELASGLDRAPPNGHFRQYYEKNYPDIIQLMEQKKLERASKAASFSNQNKPIQQNAINPPAVTKEKAIAELKRRGLIS